MLVSVSAQADDTVTIAALGDSLTQGYGLVQEDGFTVQLQDWLDGSNQDVIILNAGVSGDTTAGGLARVDWTLTPDVDAMIVTLGGNDVLRGTDPAVARGNLDGILSVAADKGIPVLLVGIDVPDNYGPDYKVEFSEIYPDLAAKYDTLYVDSFLRPLTELGTMTDVLGTYFQNDGIHPNAVGVGIIVDSIGPKVAELAQEVRDQGAQ
ncbi:arylesterase [Pacificibacter sp. AS14]|uniref:arylesterase n=1 Tax=Pacificibacter sp. AS14 TaxID=3135785 RepID=UPI00317A2FA0